MRQARRARVERGRIFGSTDVAVRGCRVLAVAIVALLAVAGSAHAQDADRVARILTERCALCHQGDAAPNGLRLDSIEALLKGGARGAVVKPSAAAASELVRRIRGQSLPRMPLTGPPFLSDEETAVIERWIDAGALQGASVAVPAAKPRAATDSVTYADVQAIFGTRCAKCHTDNGLMGPPPEGYRLNDYANMISRADRVRVVPGQPLASELLRRVRGLSLPRMPLDGPPYLTDAQIALIERWIAAGARDADGKSAPDTAGAAIRLRGTIDADGTLDGLPFRVDDARRVRAPSGSMVELRGTVGDDGRVHARRVRAR